MANKRESLKKKPAWVVAQQKMLATAQFSDAFLFNYTIF